MLTNLQQSSSLKGFMHFPLVLMNGLNKTKSAVFSSPGSKASGELIGWDF